MFLVIIISEELFKCFEELEKFEEGIGKNFDKKFVSSI